ncbi:MAG: GNAT family N-acetyltransferase [Silicimonas sp.]|nr:GNAT family N-acetyltransferase [Silicimonas sp.]
MGENAEDLLAVQRLRHDAFFAGRGVARRADGRDADGFDEKCDHVLVENIGNGRLVATFRLLPICSGADIGESYSAQFYELHGLTSYDRKMVEMGRFCVAPGERDPDILRAVWGALAAYVDREGVEMLFGCSSFHGTDAAAYADAFAMLREEHLAPKRWLPRIKAPNVLRFAQRFRLAPDRKKALSSMPPLLRSYLSLGGWVSDHAVVDRDLNTLHVFTGLEIASIPPNRARVLLATPG